MAKIFVYLARRDKKGVQLLTTIPGAVSQPNRLTDIKQLGLPPGAEQEVHGIIHENRMLWEPWFEGAESYADLLAALKSRGYSGLRMYSSPLYRNSELRKMRSEVKVEKIKTMIRKGN